MKRFILVFFVLTFSILSSPLFAQRHIIDDVGILNSADAAALERTAAEIARTYNFDLAIVIKNDIGGAELISYADELYNEMGFGDDGCLLLLVMGAQQGDRDYRFSTTGSGIKLLDENPRAFDRLDSAVGRHLRNNDFATASNTFFSTLEEFLVLESKGRNYNFFHQWNLVIMIVVWVTAFVLSFMTVGAWKKQMDTALPQKDATGFIVPGTLAFTNQKERFLYSSVKKIKRQDTSTAAKVAGSAIRTSSSGRRHGGRSGKF